MKLIKLIAKNFKKLSDFTAEFADGLNVLVGENAQGKSTTLQAIEAALFGVTVVPGKKENIPTWGQSNFNLELWFQVENLAYVLTRTKSTAKLVAAGVDGEPELLANGNTPVTKYVEELLGLTAKDFNLFVQSKQGETAGVLTFGATALNQKVEEFAGISVIDEVTRKAQDRATASKTLSTQLAVSQEELGEANEDYRQAVARMTSAHEELTAAQAAMGNLPAEPQAPPVRSEELARTRREADRRISALREAEAALEAKITACVSAEEDLAAAEHPASVSDLEEQQKQVKLEIANIRRGLAGLEEDRQRKDLLVRQAAQAAAEFSAAEIPGVSVIAFAEDELEKAKEGLRKASDCLAELAGRRRSLETLAKGAMCPTCGSKLSEHDPDALAAEIAELKDQEAAALALREAGTKEVTRLTRHVDSLHKASADWQRLADAADAADAACPSVEDVQRLADEIADRQDSLNLFIADQANLQAQLDRASSVAERHQTLMRRVVKARGEAEAAVTARDEACSRLIDAPTDVEIDTAAQAEAKYREERTYWLLGKQQADSRLKLADTNYKQAESDVVRTKGALESLERMDGEAEGHALEADRASRLARFLRDRRQSYLKEVWDGVLAVASKHVCMATRGLITKVAYEAGEFQFEEDGVMAPLTSASGAQKAFVGTAVRIGLARALYGSDSLLIFDEPTESMSERNASGLAASLVGSAHQILLITHRDQDQGLAANIITVGE